MYLIRSLFVEKTCYALHVISIIESVCAMAYQPDAGGDGKSYAEYLG
jgi:hypothetical protein